MSVLVIKKLSWTVVEKRLKVAKVAKVARVTIAAKAAAQLKSVEEAVRRGKRAERKRAKSECRACFGGPSCKAWKVQQRSKVAT